MSALNETEEFEFLHQLEKEAAAGIPPPNPAPMKASMGDVIAGTPLARLAMGAASPLIGAAQVGAHVGDVANRAMGVEPVVSPWLDQHLAAFEASKQRGMKAAGTEGVDWWGLLGNVAPSAAIGKGVSAALPAATTVLQRAGIGALQGGAAAAAQPVTNTEDGFWSPKGVQTAVGTVAGGVIPLVMDAGKGIGRLVMSATQPFTETGRAAILRELQDMVLGNDPHLRKIARDVLSRAQPGVGGVMPTAGEVLAGIEDPTQAAKFTGLMAHQQNIAKLPGVSPEFTARAAEQSGARATVIQDQLSPYVSPDVTLMKKAIEARAFPLKEQALNAANKLNVVSGSMKGMPISQLNANLYDVEKQVEGNAPLEKYLQTLRTRVIEKAREFHPSGTRIDATVLAHMRDQVKNDISGLAGNERVSKTSLQKYAIDAEKAIDRAIESAGGTGKWDEWRKVYSGGMQEIERVQAGHDLAQASRGTAAQFQKSVTEASGERWMQPEDKAKLIAVLAEKQRAATMGKLANQTSLSGADAVPGQVGLPLPNLLSRPAMVANFILRHAGQGAENKIAQLAKAQYLNPNQFAASLEEVPPRYAPMMNALRQRIPAMAGAATARALQP